MRTKEQITEEVKKLEDIKRRVRPQTAFGDSNVGAVAAQIKVLERSMDEDDIYDFFDYDSHLLGAALEALYWVTEEEDEAPSTNWESLCEPKEEQNE